MSQVQLQLLGNEETRKIKRKKRPISAQTLNLCHNSTSVSLNFPSMQPTYSLSHAESPSSLLPYVKLSRPAVFGTLFSLDLSVRVAHAGTELYAGGAPK